MKLIIARDNGEVVRTINVQDDDHDGEFTRFVENAVDNVYDTSYYKIVDLSDEHIRVRYESC